MESQGPWHESKIGFETDGLRRKCSSVFYISKKTKEKDITMETQEKKESGGIKWSIKDIQPQPVARVTTEVTVISERDRIREIQRIEMDRILFWND